MFCEQLVGTESKCVTDLGACYANIFCWHRASMGDLGVCHVAEELSSLNG